MYVSQLRRCLLLIALLVLPFSACKQGGGIVEITLVQMNDVYEMKPLGVLPGNPGVGGLARVATLVKKLERENPDTYVFCAGDLASPSAIRDAIIDGERLAGKQMIAAMNALGLDYMTFGNHEFDIKETELRSRMDESESTWVSSNITDSQDKLFQKSVRNAVFETKGTPSLKVGIFGLTLDTAGADWVTYNMELNQVAKEQVEDLRNNQQAKVVIGLTHLTMATDKEVATVEGIDLILGGHEHSHMLDESHAPVFKADANAMTVYVHKLSYDTGSGKLDIASELVKIDGTIPDDPATSKVVNAWYDKAVANMGIDPTKVVVTPTEALDGRSSVIRSGQTNLTRILADGMATVSGNKTVIYNTGTVRIDDTLPEGVPITEYDIRRILPFGGTFNLVSVKGDTLQKTLVQGEVNAGSGGYLQWSNISKDADGAWRVDGAPLDLQKDYPVIFADFLLTGKEAGLDFLKCDGEACSDGMKFLESGASKGWDMFSSLRIGLKAKFP